MYDKDGPFVDPVVRCDKCNRILKLVDIKTIGVCVHCGARRIRNCLSFTEEEWRTIKDDWQVDPDWLKLFEGVNP